MNNEAGLDPEIATHYEREANEKDRLSTAAVGRLEWLRTWQVLSEHLPPPPATVPDVGGGPGAYALPLARRGYATHLLDPVARHVEEARAASHAQPEPESQPAPARRRPLSRLTGGQRPPGASGEDPRPACRQR